MYNMMKEGTVTLPLGEYLDLHDAFNELLKIQDVLVTIVSNVDKVPELKTCIPKDVIIQAWNKVKTQYPGYNIDVTHDIHDSIYKGIRAIGEKTIPDAPHLIFKEEQ